MNQDRTIGNGPMRFLRSIAKDGDKRLFAGNQNCRRILVEAGLITASHKTGQWWELRATEEGQKALVQ